MVYMPPISDLLRNIKAGGQRTNPMRDWFFGINLNADFADFPANDEGMTRAYLASLWAYRCIKLRSMRLGAIPLVVKTHDDEWVDREGKPTEERVRSFTQQHILQKMVGQRAARTKRQLESDLCIWGRGILEPTKQGLHRLNPKTIEVVKDEHGVQEFRQFLNGSVVATWEPDELIYIYDYDPDDDLGGVPPMLWALRAAGVEVNVNEFVDAFFENDATPAGILTTDQPMQDPEIERAVKWWEKMFRGVRKKGTVGVVGNGLRFEAIGSNLGDLAITELRLEVRRDVTAAFGVPMTIAQADEAANYSTANEQYKAFYTETIIPELEMICEELNQQLVPHFGNHLTIKPDVSGIKVLHDDAESVANRTSTAFGAGTMTLNETREAMELPPLDHDYIMIPNIGVIRQDDLDAVARATAKAATTTQGEQTWSADGITTSREMPEEPEPQPDPSPNPASNGNKPKGPLPDKPKDVVGIQGPLDPKPTGLRPNRPDTPPVRVRSVLRQAAIDDIKRWMKKVDSKGVKSTFTSDAIPSSIAGFLRWDLLDAEDEHGRKAAFKAAEQQILSTDPTPEEFEAYWSGLDDIAQDLIAGFGDLLENEELRKRIADNLSETGDVDLAISTVETFTEAWVDALVGTLEEPGPLSQIFLAGAARGDELHTEMLAMNLPTPRRHSALKADEKFDVSTAWGLIHKDALSFARDYAYDLVRGINDVTTQSFREGMSDWIEKGGGLTGLTDYLYGRLQGLDIPTGWSPKKIEWATSRERARNIAQTESTRAFTEGNVQRWQQLGVKDIKWRTQNDRVVCPACKSLNSTVVAHTQGFWDKLAPAFRLNYTAEQAKRPPLHPGCRCFPSPVTASRNKPLELVGPDADFDDLNLSEL